MTKEQIYGMTHVYQYNLFIHLSKTREQYSNYYFAIINYLDL